MVDPGPQEEKIKKGDPAILMRRVIDDRQDVPQKQIDDATEWAVKKGVLTLSETIFNEKRNRALVSYSFVCGEYAGRATFWFLRKSVKSGRFTRLVKAGFRELLRAILQTNRPVRMISDAT